MQCLLGMECKCYFPFEARPSHPHDQEQESSLSEREVIKSESHNAWRCCRRRHGWNGALSSPAAPTTRYLILLHWYIPSIYQVYTRYLPMSKYIPGIYQGYIKYILGIYHVYRRHWYIPGIYLVYIAYIATSAI